jgi:hypothetical protein
LLNDVSQHSQIDFCHTDGSNGRLHIVETITAGVATFDYDGDGLIDIYFLNGAPLADQDTSARPQNRLYRNLGNMRFVDVTEEAGVGDPGFGLAVAVGDYDNDGYPDIYLSNFGRNVMYRNHGDGTFTEVAAANGTAADEPRKVGGGTSFLDIDRDGDLDVFAANYVGYSCEERIHHTWRGMPIYPGPERFKPHAPHLFRNNSDGTFTDISEESGVGQHPGYGMGIVCADVDADGDTDIFVGNDGGTGNHLFQNDGKGNFEEIGLISGAAYSGIGLANNSMGADCGDYNNDGRLDFYVTSYQSQSATLFHNLGDASFEDVTRKTGAGLGSVNDVTWGCNFVDLDNDGHRDLFYVCGHLIDVVDLLDDTTSYLARPVVLRNTGRGRFVDVTASCGDGPAKKSVGRGLAVDDLDNDGDVDAVILNSRRPSTVLQNNSPGNNHWIQITLRGVASNRDGIGAWVKVTAGDLTQLDEVHSGRGYQSHSGTQLHFGLGNHRHVDRIEVRWIGGGTQTLVNVAADQAITVIEGDERAHPR